MSSAKLATILGRGSWVRDKRSVTPTGTVLSSKPERRIGQSFLIMNISKSILLTRRWSPKWPTKSPDISWYFKVWLSRPANIPYGTDTRGPFYYMMTSSNGNISTLLALCAGNSPVTGEFPSQRPVTRSFDVFFDLCLNKRLSKQSRSWWFETPSHPLWRHCNEHGFNLATAWISNYMPCKVLLHS